MGEYLYITLPSSTATATIDGSTYAMVASYSDGGIQILDITNPAIPQAVEFIRSHTIDVNGDLYGVSGSPTHVATDVIGGTTYALVTTESNAQILIIDMTDPYNTLAVAHVVKTESDDESVLPNQPKSVATAHIGGRTFALVAGGASNGAGINIMDITDPANPVPFGLAPFITLNTNPPQYAIWRGGETDGLNQLTFEYRVAEDDTSDDLGYTSVMAFDLNGNHMTDANGDNIDMLPLPAPGTSNSLSGSADIVIDSLAPTISSATATSLTSISVVLSEPVFGGTLNGSAWNISGKDAGLRNVVASTVSNGTNVVAITLSDPLPDTAPDIFITHTPQDGGIIDAASNRLDDTAPVQDGLPPEIASVDAISGNMINIVFTEPVTGGVTGLVVSRTLNAVAISSNTISGSNVTLMLDNEILGPDKPVLGYTPGNIVDGTGNALIMFEKTMTKSGIDGIPPTILNATAINPTTLHVMFSENVDTDLTTGGQWRLSGEDVPLGLVITRNADPAGNTDTMLIYIMPRLQGASPSASLEYVAPDGENVGRIWDNAQNPLAAQTVPILDGVIPEYMKADAVSPTSIMVTFNEEMAGGAAGFTIHDTINDITVTGAFSSGNSLTLELSAAILGPDLPQIKYDADTGDVTDVAGNALLGFLPRSVTTSGIDNDPPTITSAIMSVPDAITVTFSESVYGAAKVDPWILSGGDVSINTIDSVTDPNGTNTVTLNLSENQVDTAPPTHLKYVPENGTLTDGAANPVDIYFNSIGDDLGPRIISVTAVSPHRITILFTEQTSGDGSGFTISGTENEIVVAPSTFTAYEPTPSVSLNLVGDILSPDNPKLHYDSNVGSVHDRYLNQMLSIQDVPIDKDKIDDTPPTIVSAVATAPDRITVTLSEDVIVERGTDLTAWSFSGTDSGSLRVTAIQSPRFSTSMTLTLSPNLPDTKPDLSITYSSGGGIADDALNLLVGSTVEVRDGLDPEVASASVRSDTQIRINFTEPVTGNTDGFSVHRGSNIIHIGEKDIDGDTVTLTVSNDMVGPDRLLLSYDKDPGSVVADMASNLLAGFKDRIVLGTTIDPQRPVIVSATAIAANQIEVVFSEAVKGVTASNIWSLAGNDASGLRVQSSPDPGGTNTITLTLTGNLPDTQPNIALRYIQPREGGITDIRLNPLLSASVRVQDALPPEVISADARSPTKITVTLTEPVTGNLTGWTLSVSRTAIDVSSISFASNRAVLTLSGEILGTDVPTLSYDSVIGDMRDGSENRLGGFADLSVGTPGIDNTPPTILSAVAIGPTSISVEFTEPVNIGGTDGAGWSVSSQYVELFTVTENTNSDGNVMILTLSGSLPDTSPSMILTYDASEGDIADGSLNPLETATVQVLDKLAPNVAQASLMSPHVMVIRFTENVNGYTSGFSIKNTTNPIGIHYTYVQNSDAVTLYLRDPVPVSDILTLSYNPITSDMLDGTSNFMHSFENIPVDRNNYDGDPPTIVSAVATAPDRITVTLSEDVIVERGADLTAWNFSGVDSGSLRVIAIQSPGFSTSVTLILSPNLPDTKPDLSITYSSGGGIADDVLNLLAGNTVEVGDGLDPEVASVSVRSDTQIRINFTEPVTGNTGGFSVHRGSSMISIAQKSIDVDTVTLTVSNDVVGPDRLLLSYDKDSGNVADRESNLLAGFEDRLVLGTTIDPQHPVIVSATAIAANQIEVVFSEAVKGDTASSVWSLAGSDSSGLRVQSSPDPGGTNTITLTLTGNLPDTQPNIALLYIKPREGGITDIRLNPLLSVGVLVQDALPPEAVSADATSPTEITVTLTEPVTGNLTGWTLSVSRTAIDVSSISFASNRAVLTLSGEILGTDVPTLSYDSVTGDMRDGSENRLGGFADLSVGLPGIDSTPPAILSASVTDPASIRVEFTEPVNTEDADGAGWSVSDQYTESFTITENINLDGNVMILTLSGSLPDTSPSMILTYDASEGDIVDGSSNPLETATVQVLDKLAPNVAQASLMSPHVMVIQFTENVNGYTSGFSIKDTTNPIGIHYTYVQNSDAVTLYLRDPVPVSDILTLSYNPVTSDMLDGASNFMHSFENIPVDRNNYDGDPPTIVSAVATSLSRIHVTFSEPITHDRSQPGDWTLSGDDASESLAVSNVNQAGGGHSIP